MSLLNNVRWNLSRHTRLYEGVDSFIVSVPKSGRTWVRFFLQSYFCALDGCEFALNREQFEHPSIPRVLFTHDLFEHATEPSLLGRLAGKQLIPRALRHAKPVILLARDPRDVIVSLYFQLTRREKRSKRYQGTISEMLRDRTVGIGTVIWAMNAWLDEWSGHPQFRLVRYEDLRREPMLHFREILIFLGLDQVDPQLLARAEASARFENMRKLESQGNVRSGHSGLMRPGDQQDPESFKVRKGQVGGFRDYLDARDIECLDEALRGLDPRFGYQAGQDS